MTVKGRPEKKSGWSRAESVHRIEGWNDAIDADTEYFVSVLEGLKMTPKYPEEAITIAVFNARIEGALREVKK